MLRLLVISVTLSFVSGAAIGQESEQQAAETPSDPEQPELLAQEAAPEEGGVKSMLGMSILGNEEAPKSLVIVPWKSSEIGDGIGVSNVLDDRAVPVDKDVFMRELHYYQIRSNGTD
jgi:hypothetical protein